MRKRPSILSAAVALTFLAACDPVTSRGDAAVAAPPAPAPTRTVAPASAAGGACHLLSFADIAATLGVRFDVSAAGKRQKTSACAVQRAGASRPDLVLTATPTEADGAIFAAEVRPKGAAKVKDLGVAAYQRALPPAGGAGPAAEVGWLTGDGRLLTLRFTLPADADEGAGTAALPKLVALARIIDRSSL